MKTNNIIKSYNEIRQKENQVIYEFLKQQADIRYGNQMFSYHLSAPIEVLCNTSVDTSISVHVTDIYITNGDVEFTARIDNRVLDLNCTDFKFGELSKIIEALPEPTDLIRSLIKLDYRRLLKDGDYSIEEHPFVWYDGDYKYECRHIFKKGEQIMFDVLETNTKTNAYCSDLLDEIPQVSVARALRNHIMSYKLRGTDEYLEVEKLLKQFGGNCYSFVEHLDVGLVRIDPMGCGVDLTVLDVSLTSDGLEVLVSVEDTGMKCDERDTIVLHEYELDTESLKVISSYLDNRAYIMDANSSHDPDLVRKINSEWIRNKDAFTPIMFALFMKYYDEIANSEWCPDIDAYYEWPMQYAHQIMMHVLDDEDLKLILNFINK